MCPPGYHHNGIIAAHELGHTMYGYIYIYRKEGINQMEESLEPNLKSMVKNINKHGSRTIYL